MARGYVEFLSNMGALEPISILDKVIVECRLGSILTDNTSQLINHLVCRVYIFGHRLTKARDIDGLRLLPFLKTLLILILEDDELLIAPLHQGGIGVGIYPASQGGKQWCFNPSSTNATTTRGQYLKLVSVGNVVLRQSAAKIVRSSNTQPVAWEMSIGLSNLCSIYHQLVADTPKCNGHIFVELNGCIYMMLSLRLGSLYLKNLITKLFQLIY